MTGDPLNSCTSFELQQLDQERSEKKGLLINSCTVKNMLHFQPNCNDAVAIECFCHCDIFLALSFDNCGNKEGTNEHSILEDIKSGEKDSKRDSDSETVNRNCVLNFVDVPSFVAILSGNLNKQLYFVKVGDKIISESEIKVWPCHFYWRALC